MHPVVAAVTARIRERSQPARSAYLQRRAAACAVDRAQLLAQDAAEDSDDP